MVIFLLIVLSYMMRVAAEQARIKHVALCPHPVIAEVSPYGSKWTRPRRATPP